MAHAIRDARARNNLRRGVVRAPARRQHAPLLPIGERLLGGALWAIAAAIVLVAIDAGWPTLWRVSPLVVAAALLGRVLIRR